MDFYDELSEIGLEYVLERPVYKSIKMENSDTVYNAINDILKTNAKVLVYGDYDTDGLMCIKVWEEFFNLIGFTNYKTYRYSERMHTLDPKAVREALEEKYEYMVISDTASSEICEGGLIHRLLKFGVKPVVIDHHQTIYEYKDYPKDCAIVNNTIENRMYPDREEIRLSAGALCFVVLDYYISQYYPKVDTNLLSAYALISLYADSIDMSGTINRAIYYKATQLSRRELPSSVSLFMTPNSKFGRRFIEFQYTPRINCVFRNEMFPLLNSYVSLKNNKDIPKMVKRVDMLTSLHLDLVKVIGQVADIIEYEVLDNFILANLNSVNNFIDIETYKLYNYTGLVANRLAERFGKPAVVWCMWDGEIKGSFRDLLSRSYLKTFQQFCVAGGHDPAFGFHLQPLEFENFLRFIKRIDKKFYIEGEPNRPIIIDHRDREPDEALLNDIALYNEFGGNKIPITLVKKAYTADIKEKASKYGGYTYRWDKYFINSSHRYKYGDYILFKPTIEKSLRLYGV